MERNECSECNECQMMRVQIKAMALIVMWGIVPHKDMVCHYVDAFLYLDYCECCK